MIKAMALSSGPKHHFYGYYSNQWNYRWVNANEEEFYTNDDGDDPNRDPLLNQAEWKRTPVRPRFPQS